MNNFLHFSLGVPQNTNSIAIDAKNNHTTIVNITAMKCNEDKLIQYNKRTSHVKTAAEQLER